ncbi:MAG TPA: 5-formyltetrahydrofolate cyclo-ligase [Chthoniobacterales bacterium]
MISSEKQTLRLRMRESLRAITPDVLAEKSAAIGRHLAAGLGAHPGLVLGFAPMRAEPDWTSAVGPGWNLALPRIDSGRMTFHRVAGLGGLAKGAHGVLEPAVGEGTLVLPGEASVVLVPGMAFDRRGGRLGKGGGFYDRLLVEGLLRARRIAVCFACQVVGSVPVEPHDMEVDAIVTEDGWTEVRSSGRDRD